MFLSLYIAKIIPQVAIIDYPTYGRKIWSYNRVIASISSVYLDWFDYKKSIKGQQILKLLYLLIITKYFFFFIIINIFFVYRVQILTGVS